MLNYTLNIIFRKTFQFELFYLKKKKKADLYKPEFLEASLKLYNICFASCILCNRS